MKGGLGLDQGGCRGDQRRPDVGTCWKPSQWEVLINRMVRERQASRCLQGVWPQQCPGAIGGDEDGAARQARGTDPGFSLGTW